MHEYYNFIKCSNLNRWHLIHYGLSDEPLTNNVAEATNAVFKGYLRSAGIPNQILNKKQLHEVILASKSFLECEWQALERSLYKQGDFEVKQKFQKFLLKNSRDMPPFNLALPNDVIRQINNDDRKGKHYFNQRDISDQNVSKVFLYSKQPNNQGT